MSDIIDETTDLIARGHTQAAIAKLRAFVAGLAADDQFSPVKQVRNQLVMLSATAADLQNAIILGTVAPAELQQSAARLRLALLSVINEIATLGQQPQKAAVAQSPATFEPPEESRLEKTWGRGTLQSIAWLYQGLSMAKAVCRVVAPRGLGTGFMIAPGRIVTNNHVVASPGEAANSVVQFNYEEDERGSLRSTVAYEVLGEPFATSAGLDCSVLTLVANEEQPFQQWGKLAFAPDELPEVGSHVSIIQHPNGELKKLSVTANEVVNVYEHRLQYMTDTMPGSSGSPVFNDRWQVVAVHHSGGNLVRNGRGDRIYANEGILSSFLRNAAELSAALA